MRKKEFTSFDVAASVRELKQRILDSRVSNVYQVGQKTFLLKLHKHNHQPFQFILEAGRRLHLSTYSVEKPPAPSAFCMALRAFLRNSRLTNIEQYEFERVVVLCFETRRGELQLILEVFGNGNLILVDEENKILQALTYKRMRDRNVLRREDFVFAPASGKNPKKLSFEELYDGVRACGDIQVVRALARFLGIGGQYSEEILIRAQVEKTKTCEALSLDEFKAIYDRTRDMLSQVTAGVLEPNIVLGEKNSLTDVAPFKLVQYVCRGLELRRYDSFNEACDEFYARVSAVEAATAGAEVDRLKHEAERLGRIIAEQEKLLAKGESKAELDRRIGDAIYAHIGELQTLFEKLRTGRQGGRDLTIAVAQIHAEKKTSLVPSTHFEALDTKGSTVTVSVEGLRFSLDPQRTPFENAAQFYDEAKQTKQKMRGARIAMEDTCKQLVDVEAKIRDAEALEQGRPAEALEELAKRKIRPKKWFEKFRWFLSSDGFLILGGRDAVTNEVLIRKHTDAPDLVFHADMMGAPFVVVKAEKRQPSERCLAEAGEFAAAFSRAWREGFGSVDVYWVKPEQLSKAGPSGESVAHGAFVVRGKRNWVRGVKLELAVGILVDTQGTVQFIGGPIGAVKAKTQAYVKLVPGDLSGKELLKLVLRALAGRLPKELREKTSKASIEELREYIPFGKGRLSRE